jgi:uncharacterized protein (TIGR02246 family)
VGNWEDCSRRRPPFARPRNVDCLQETEDATYVIVLGDVLRGREEIRSGHVEVFAKWQKDTRMRVKLLQIHQLGETATCISTIGDIGKASQIPFDKFQTYTLIRDEHCSWKCVAFQNTEMSGRSKQLYNHDQL